MADHPSIVRFSPGQARVLRESLKSGTLSSRELQFPMRGHLEDATLPWQEAMHAARPLQGSSLKDRLAAVFGPPDGRFPGKYAKADVFMFGFGEEKLVVQCEKEVGAIWRWICPANSPVPYRLEARAPEISHFWPLFLHALCQALDLPPIPPEVLGVGALPLLAEKDQKALEEALHESAAPVDDDGRKFRL